MSDKAKAGKAPNTAAKATPATWYAFWANRKAATVSAMGTRNMSTTLRSEGSFSFLLAFRCSLNSALTVFLLPTWHFMLPFCE